MFQITYTSRLSASGIGSSITSNVAAFVAEHNVSLLSVVKVTNPASAIIEGNCLYGGNAIGHTVGFCTADSCY